jgi:hypothetical protein
MRTCYLSFRGASNKRVYASEPGIQIQNVYIGLDSGSGLSGRPGMTETYGAKPCDS